MSINTWNIVSWTIPTSCCYSFASIIAFPSPLPCLKPCKASCRTMVLRSRLFTINVQIFHMTSTNSMPMYPPPPFGMINMFVHVIASGMYLYRNATYFILTNFPTSRCLCLSPWLPPVAMSSGVLHQLLMVTPPVPPGFFALPLQSTLLTEARPKYPLAVPGLVLDLPLVVAACRYPPT